MAFIEDDKEQNGVRINHPDVNEKIHIIEGGIGLQILNGWCQIIFKINSNLTENAFITCLWLIDWGTELNLFVG